MAVQEIDILFDEAQHKYYDRDNNVYTSVTTLIGKYTDTFDGEYWSMYTALKNHGYRVKQSDSPAKQRFILVSGHKNKLSDLYKDSLFKAWAEEVVAVWKGINLEACLRGNMTHNLLENSINISKGDNNGSTNNYIKPNIGKRTIQTIHDLDKTELKTTHPIVYNRLGGYIERGFSVFAEKRVYLSDFSIAGMIDVPLIKDKYFAILDWKTNKDVMHETTGYYKKILVGGKWIKSDKWIETDDRLKYPLDMLPSSKFHIYALQLSLYAYILEQWGYILLNNGLEILHFPLGLEPKLIKVPYLKQEVEIMLHHHKQNILIAS
jgi:hypothetical protein